MGDLSAHFSLWEFADHSTGEVYVDPRLVAALEHLRTLIGDKPIRIISGFRTPAHNRAVGGAPRSQHLFGRAADLAPGVCTLSQALDAGFKGIGVCGDVVTHVDVRRRQRALIFRDCPRTY